MTDPAPPRAARSPRVLLLAVVIAVELVAGLVSVGVLATRSQPAPSREASAPQASASSQSRIVGGLPGQSFGDSQPLASRQQVAAVSNLLRQHAQALLHHDRAAFLAGIDPQSPTFRRTQGRVFDNLRSVPLGSWDYTLDPTVLQPTTGPGLARYGSAPLWAPQVTLHYALAGFDTGSTGQQQSLTFVQRAGRWYIGGDSDFASAGQRTVRNLWDFGPVTVVRTASTLVLGHPASLATMQALPDITDAAVPRVTAVWGTGWPRKVVVLVPTSQLEMNLILGGGQSLSQIAAVTTAELPSGPGQAVGERIIVNPPNFAKLSGLGRQIVLTHEMTHVASRDATSAATPKWLAEGLADYVGYQETGLSVRQIAPELGRDISAGRVPTALPSDAAFDGGNPDIDQAYEEGWLACRLIAARIGQAGLIAFYREVGQSTGDQDAAVATALQARLHLSTAQFTDQWRAALREQLQ